MRNNDNDNANRSALIKSTKWGSTCSNDDTVSREVILHHRERSTPPIINPNLFVIHFIDLLRGSIINLPIKQSLQSQIGSSKTRSLFTLPGSTRSWCSFWHVNKSRDLDLIVRCCLVQYKCMLSRSQLPFSSRWSSSFYSYVHSYIYYQPRHLSSTNAHSTDSPPGFSVYAR